MTTLVANLPPTKVWVRREYLRDLRDGHGEYTLGYWVTCKSISGRALYFETYLTEYGALYDKLPISAFLSWDPDHPHEPEAPTPDLPLTDLQFWNGFDTGLTVVEKNLIFNMDFEVMLRSGGIMKGTYLFTIDNYHPHRNEPDFYFAESPDEHKSHNIIELENGQIGAFPNNRCRMTDPSLSNHNLKTPDFKVSTRYFNVEHVPKWGRLGEVDDYFWKTPNEIEPKEIDIDPMDGMTPEVYNAVVAEAELEDEASIDECFVSMVTSTATVDTSLSDDIDPEDYKNFRDIGLTT